MEGRAASELKQTGGGDRGRRACPGLRQAGALVPVGDGDPVTIWILCQYAGSLRHGMNYRPYFFGREFAAAGHRVVVVSGSYSHQFVELPATSGRYTREADRRPGVRLGPGPPLPRVERSDARAILVLLCRGPAGTGEARPAEARRDRGLLPGSLPHLAGRTTGTPLRRCAGLRRTRHLASQPDGAGRLRRGPSIHPPHTGCGGFRLPPRRPGDLGHAGSPRAHGRQGPGTRRSSSGSPMASTRTCSRRASRSTRGRKPRSKAPASSCATPARSTPGTSPRSSSRQPLCCTTGSYLHHVVRRQGLRGQRLAGKPGPAARLQQRPLPRPRSTFCAAGPAGADGRLPCRHQEKPAVPLRHLPHQALRLHALGQADRALLGGRWDPGRLGRLRHRDRAGGRRRSGGSDPGHRRLDAGEREAMGERGRKVLLAEYTHRALARRWLDRLERSARSIPS